MKIEHIFNAVKPKTKNMIASQEFQVEYWNKSKEGYSPPKDLSSDFSKMYYNALVATDDSIISKYDDEKLKALTDKLGNNLLLISGDFWGIQKFIFDGITTSKASKILRSRSAMVQLITYAVVDRIKKEFKGSEALLFGAGKFMILAKNKNSEKIKTIQEELDDYFLENFFGQNGFILSSTTTTSKKLLSQADIKHIAKLKKFKFTSSPKLLTLKDFEYHRIELSSVQSDLDALGADNDDKKLNKFNLLKVEDDAVVHNIFDEAQKDDDICEFCSKRVKTHNVDDTKACSVCFNEIELGKELSKKAYVTIFSSDKMESKDNIFIVKLGSRYYYAKFEDEVTVKGDSFDIGSEPYFDYPKWSLNSHVPKDEYSEIKTFSDFITKGEKTVSSGLMALKADIDKLGDTFRELYKEDFRKFNRLSREVEFFFSDYITSLVKDKKNVYTVFAGGDDLFLIGEYREIVALAKEIREEFYKFSLEKTTISMGLVMFKPSTPISFVSKMADEAERRAKAVTVDGKDRDGINIFGVSMKYNEFMKIEKYFSEVVEYLETNKVDTTTFYYHLIELCDMKMSLDRGMSDKEEDKNYKFNPNDAMWKSKLNYIIRRNINKKSNDSEIFTKISNLIEKGEKFKPSIFLKIYNNRDKKKEK